MIEADGRIVLEFLKINWYNEVILGMIYASLGYWVVT